MVNAMTDHAQFGQCLFELDTGLNNLMKQGVFFAHIVFIGCVCFTLTPDAAISLGGSCARRTPIVPCEGHGCWGSEDNHDIQLYHVRRLMNLCWSHKHSRSMVIA